MTRNALCADLVTSQIEPFINFLELNFVLKSPKGWTEPKVVDGLQIEGTSRSHQVPLLLDAGHPAHVQQLENRNLHVQGYKEEGTITTPFDIRVQNQLDRFHLVLDVVNCLPHLGS